MDNFGAITESVNRGSGDSISTGNANAVKSKKNNLQLLSDQALTEMLDKMRLELDNIPDENKAKIQSKIDALEKEIVSRNIPKKPVVDAPDSSKVKEKSTSIGANVGTGALLFGIIGVVAGYSYNRDKVIMWGLGGAVIGSLTAYILTSNAKK